MSTLEQRLRADAETILRASIGAVRPDSAVRRALEGAQFPGRVFLVAAGKAAWQMASVARETLPALAGGVVVTKYGHIRDEIADAACYEGGHPVPDENSLRGTAAALALTANLRADDTVLFLLSGGGSALFEQPLLPLADLQDITRQLLAAGADIVEINTVRKRLSAVKGGRFAAHCAPAQVFSIVLSDIVGDPLDMIASGPACPDRSTCAQALAVAEKYRLRLSPHARAGAIRSSRLPPRSASRGFAMRSSPPPGRTARTARPTPRAASSMAARRQKCAGAAFRPSARSKTTIPTTPCARRTRSFSPAPRGRMSTTSRSCCCGPRNKKKACRF